MIKLEGHSGCDLSLVSKNGKLFVRKTSKDTIYNERLEKQCQKQRDFKNNLIKTPTITDFGIDNLGLYYFEMEYIKGFKFNEFVKIKKFSQVVYVFKKILDFIFDNFSDKMIDFSSEINSKIDSINSSKLIDSHVINQLKFYSKLQCKHGYCHGDLTFENIIISNNEIYLIDFLDSYIESPIIDISKLLQEFDTNWSNRNMDKDNAISLIRNIFLKRQLQEMISQKDINILTIESQRKLTLMRILPYTSSITLQLKLLNIINK